MTLCGFHVVHAAKLAQSDDVLSVEPGASPWVVQCRAVRNEGDLQDVRLSVDTFYSRVAEEAVGAGADMVNDVSAGRLDPDMHAVVSLLPAT